MMDSNITNISVVFDIFKDGLDTITLGYIFLVTSILVTISYTLAMVVVILSKELHTPSLLNIAFMALCDGCFGLYFLISDVPSAFLNRFAYSKSMIVPSACINALMYGQNCLNILLAAVDRFIAVCYPLRYHKLMSSKRFGLAVFVTILINICRCIAIFTPGGDVYFSKQIAHVHVKYDNPVSTFAAIGIPFAITVIIGFIVAYLILDIWRFNRRLHSETSSHRPGSQLTVTIILSSSLFCLAYIPACSTVLWVFTHCRDNVPVLMGQFSLFTVLSNSLWNVVIYAVTYRPFRDAALRLFCATMHRRQRQIELNETFQIRTGPDGNARFN